MTKTRKLSPTQKDALAKLDEHGALERWEGGFWTYPGCKVDRMVAAGAGTGGPRRIPVPTWWIQVQTVNVLVAQGLAVPAAYATPTHLRRVEATLADSA